jgi:hypothetical protein
VVIDDEVVPPGWEQREGRWGSHDRYAGRDQEIGCLGLVDLLGQEGMAGVFSLLGDPNGGSNRTVGGAGAHGGDGGWEPLQEPELYRETWALPMMATPSVLPFPCGCYGIRRGWRVRRATSKPAKTRSLEPDQTGSSCSPEMTPS